MIFCFISRAGLVIKQQIRNIFLVVFITKPARFILQNIESTGEFLEANAVFDQNPAYAVREQLHRFRTKPTADSDSP